MPALVDGEALREAMRHVPSPVTVVTAVHEGERRGITIGSFTSASLDPPLITFNLSREAQMYPLIEKTSRFAVHILSEEQAFLGNHFAIPDASPEEQFASIPFTSDPGGSPILLGAVVVFMCTRHAIHDAGDHVIVIGEVVDVYDAHAGRPIIYYDRNYRRVGKAADSTLFEPLQGGGPATDPTP